MHDSNPYGVDFENNLKLQEREYNENKVVLKSLPTRLSIIFGNRCNLKCKMCGNRGLFTRLRIKETTRLSENALNHLFSYLPFIEVLSLSGGEPLFYKEAKKTVEIAEKFPNIRLRILTNGNLINNYWTHKFCELPFKIVSISLDAATQKTYQSIRLHGDFNKVLESLNKINNMKNGKEPEIILNFVVMRRNLHEILKFVELAHKYNVSKILFQAISNQRLLFYNLENVTLTKKRCFKLLKICDKLKDIADDYNIEVVNRIPANIFYDRPKFFYEYHKTNKNDLNCNGGFKCVVNWRKVDISPEFFNICPYAVPAKFAPIYYTTKTPTIHELWNNKVFIKARRLMIEQKYDYVCKDSCLKLFNYKTKGIL